VNALLTTMVRSALLLAAFAAAGGLQVALTHAATRERIAEAERQALLRDLHAVVSPDTHDNDLAVDVTEVRDPARLGTAAPIPVYRARRGGEPVAVVLTPVAPDGYSGSIHLMVGIARDGRLTGVRVLSHRETPGLGDDIEARRSGWILAFAGRSLGDPKREHWKVKRDGGVFDQFTGATITPRAVVKAVRNALELYAERGAELFADPSTPATAELDR
jgi:electron transport complex protein RnfG